MGLPRYARRVDSTQADIVDALESAGVQVWVISRPCDLLTLYRGRWQPLEVKTPGPPSRLRRADQKAQQEFLDQTRTPVVSTASQALDAILGP